MDIGAMTFPGFEMLLIPHCSVKTHLIFTGSYGDEQV